MSDLFEELFGPSKVVESPRKSRDELMVEMLRGGSRWKCEEHIASLLDAFETVVEAPISNYMKKLWVAGARDFHAEFGEDTELLVETARHLIGKGMDVPSPRSCIKTAFSRKRKRHDDEAYRQSYLKGWLDK